MRRVALVTDSTAGLSAAMAAELGVTAVPASFAFAEERFLDGSETDVYGRMRTTLSAPRTFGVAEAAFRTAFEAGLKRHDSVLAVLAPFDVNPSFTTACAAMLGIQFDHPGAAIKVSNAGVGGAGLGALILSLAQLANTGAEAATLLAAIDELEPQCDSLYVPAGIDWLDRSGRLSAIEERLGVMEDRTPVLRLGTRIIGVAALDNADAALEAAIERVGARAGRSKLNVSIVHAGDPESAARVTDRVSHKWPVVRADIAEMSPTHGSQLGPGAIGIGVCPVKGEA
jgi:DegV family protein with EDD domain